MGWTVPLIHPNSTAKKVNDFRVTSVPGTEQEYQEHTSNTGQGSGINFDDLLLGLMQSNVDTEDVNNSNSNSTADQLVNQNNPMWSGEAWRSPHNG